MCAWSPRPTEEGEFRLDLYHRLNAFEIFLPPLRERGDDIELLLDFFLLRFNRQLGKQISGISEETLSLLKSYHWPGNVRELQSVVRKAMLMATGPVIVPEFLPAELREQAKVPSDGLRSTANPAANDFLATDVDLPGFIETRIEEGSEDIYAETLEAMERCLLTRVLNETGGNQSQAAQRLGITRGSLRNKIRTLGISIGSQITSDCACDE